MTDLESIRKLVSEYIDEMPPLSKVNYPDLVHVVRMRGNPAWRQDIVSCIAHDVVSERHEEVRVEKGRGICKVYNQTVMSASHS